MYDIVVIGNPTIHNGILSGPCIYSAATVAKLGHEQMAIVSAVGNDFSEVFAQGVDALGIPEYFIVRSENRNAVRIQNPSVNHGTSILGIPNRINIGDIPDEFLKTRAVLLTPSLQEITAEFVEWICSSTDAQVLLDPQLRGLGSNGRLEIIREFSVMEKTQSYLDVIKSNQLESELITGESDPFLAAELIVEWASEICVITLGEEGSLVYDGKDFNRIPSYLTKVVDTTGAGSVYLSAFTSQLIDGKPLIDCSAYATSAASIKVENGGFNFDFDDTDLKRRYEEVVDSVTTR